VGYDDWKEFYTEVEPMLLPKSEKLRKKAKSNQVCFNSVTSN